MFDRDGRTVMFTRYFCAPYEHLRKASLSYMTLYHQFREQQLPPGNDPRSRSRLLTESRGAA